MERIESTTEIIFKGKLNLKNGYDPTLENDAIEHEMCEQGSILADEYKKDLEVVFGKDKIEEVYVEFEDANVIVTTMLTEKGIKYFFGNAKSERFVSEAKDLCEAQVLSFTLHIDKLIYIMNRKSHINDISNMFGKMQQIINESYATIVQNEKEIMFKYPIKTDKLTIVGVNSYGKLITDEVIQYGTESVSTIINNIEIITLIADEVLARK